MLILSVPFVPLNQDPTTHLTASKALTHLFLTTPAKQQNNTISQHTTRTLTNAQDGIMQLELCTLFRIWCHGRTERHLLYGYDYGSKR